MTISRSMTSIVVALLVIAGQLASTQPAAAFHSRITGYVTDATTGQPIAGVCVYLGIPGATCPNRTDADGFYVWDLSALFVPDGQQWALHFIKSGYQDASSGAFIVDGEVRWNQPMMPTGQRQLCPAARTGTATQTVYLPNVTKTLGGATGWQTPFIVQNTGTAAATLEVTYLRFLNGSCAVRRTVSGLLPGRSFADVPNSDHDLPGDTQFAVVVKSFGATVVSVVNQHAGSGDRAEALSYVGVSQGDREVFLPNIVRRFWGRSGACPPSVCYYSPFIIQNLGTIEATATARFVSFDGSAQSVSVVRQIPAGGSKVVDPNSESGLVDGKQYTVTVSTGAQPISVVVNTHNDALTVAAPLAYSTNGIVGGTAVVYGPYAARNAQGVGRVSTIVVQNLAAVAITPTLTFTSLTSNVTQTFTAPEAVGPGRAWAFDPRNTVGTTTPCSVPGPRCLADGEYSFVAESGDPDNEIAVAVNVISDATAMGYTGIGTPEDVLYLPNVTKTLGGTDGWTTPILLQTAGATGATLKWYRFSDGALAYTQTVTIPRDGAVRIDPRDQGVLPHNTQFAVVIEGTGGKLAAIVVELAGGGDNAMIYEGFAAPVAQ